jgi:photosystem II stability/assembly factor-like uncharacterized protein
MSQDESPKWIFTRPIALIGIDVFSERVIWAADGGFNQSPGVVVRTNDGGRHWAEVTPPHGEDLVFRTIKVFDPDRVVVQTSSTGRGSRIFRTVDGGRNWRQVFINDDHVLAETLFAGMAFFNDRHGLAVAESINGSFPVIVTADNGEHWAAVREGISGALDGEGMFATGTSLVTTDEETAFFGTVGSDQPHSRIFRTVDRGRHWTAVETPIPGEIGIRSIAFWDRRHALAVGGNPSGEGVAITTSDAGRTWQSAGSPTGPRNCVHWISESSAVAVGVGGSDFTADGGQTWTRFDDATLLGIDGVGSAIWAVGASGAVARLKV